MVLIHGLLEPEWFRILMLMALLSLSLIGVLAYGLRKAYGKKSKPSPKGLKNADEGDRPDAEVE